jgi:hypothetical protein
MARSASSSPNVLGAPRHFKPSQGVPNRSKPFSEKKDGFIIFILHVANAGLPTSLWNYKAYVNLVGQDGQIHEMDASIPSLEITRTNQVMTLVGPFMATRDNYLLDALSSTPMQSGASGSYWVEVHINGLSDIPTGTHVFITFDDVFDRETKIDYIWTPNE